MTIDIHKVTEVVVDALEASTSEIWDREPCGVTMIEDNGPTQNGGEFYLLHAVDGSWWRVTVEPGQAPDFA